jgi:hypothetical protein
VLKRSHDNPRKSLGLLSDKMRGKFDRHDAFCHIIALRFHRSWRSQAADSSVKMGIAVNHNGHTPTATWRGSDPLTTPSRRLSRFIGDQPMDKALSKKASLGLHHSAGRKTTPLCFIHHDWFIESLAFHRTAV